MLVIFEDINTGVQLLKKKMSIIPDSRFVYLSDSQENMKQYEIVDKEYKVYYADYCQDTCTLYVSKIED